MGSDIAYRANISGSDAPPIVTHVARWPGQEGAIYEEKVPSLLIYDAEGEVCVVPLVRLFSS